MFFQYFFSPTKIKRGHIYKKLSCNENLLRGYTTKNSPRRLLRTYSIPEGGGYQFTASSVSQYHIKVSQIHYI